jgi:ribosomal-protein-alanine N-acetyltransferase
MGGKIRLKSVNRLTTKNKDELVEILNNDPPLACALGNGSDKITTLEFTKNNYKWNLVNNAEMYAIVLNGKAVGMISLSHINQVDRSARIGYWLASKFWGQGIMGKAFQQILTIAKNNKLKTVSCTIPKDNAASIAIWVKHKAKIKEDVNFLIPKIELI